MGSVKCSLHDSFNKKHCISKAFDTNYDNQRLAEVRSQQKALNDLVDEMQDSKNQSENKLKELGNRLIEAACRFERQKAKEDQEKIDADMKWLMHPKTQNWLVSNKVKMSRIEGMT